MPTSRRAQREQEQQLAAPTRPSLPVDIPAELVDDNVAVSTIQSQEPAVEEQIWRRRDVRVTEEPTPNQPLTRRQIRMMEGGGPEVELPRETTATRERRALDQSQTELQVAAAQIESFSPIHEDTFNRRKEFFPQEEVVSSQPVAQSSTPVSVWSPDARQQQIQEQQQQQLQYQQMLQREIEARQQAQQPLTAAQEESQVPTTSNGWTLASHPDEDTRRVGKYELRQDGSTLVMPANDSLTGPIASTGEILLTGQFVLPNRLSETGSVTPVDSYEVDDFLDSQVDEVTSDVLPVSAARAVSSVGGSMLGGKMPKRKRLPLIITLISVGLALIAGGLVAYAFMTGIF